ncbi:MAG TPA: 50S ribosomal protein L5 [Thermoplasmata archaeon]|jgi:large subunit ribosomal protein L5|nr:MAG TPA: 50S ribosomal protein L5 [Thermoplasmata archaeon]
MSAKKTTTSKAHKTATRSKKSSVKKKEEKQIMKPRLAKVTVNIGVGEAGEKLKKAESVLEGVTKQKPIQTLSKTTSKDWGLRKFMPIGCKVTLRKKAAEAFLKNALKIRENKISEYSFDDQGNFSFGVPDHTLFEGQKYDPNIGIFGMDICVTIEKPGYRIKHRRIDRRKIPQRQQLTREATMKFITEAFNVEVVE